MEFWTIRVTSARDTDRWLVRTAGCNADDTHFGNLWMSVIDKRIPHGIQGKGPVKWTKLSSQLSESKQSTRGND